MWWTAAGWAACLAAIFTTGALETVVPVVAGGRIVPAACGGVASEEMAGGVHSWIEVIVAPLIGIGEDVLAPPAFQVWMLVTPPVKSDRKADQPPSS
jgi:hypothetical protein